MSEKSPREISASQASFVRQKKGCSLCLLNPTRGATAATLAMANPAAAAQHQARGGDGATGRPATERAQGCGFNTNFTHSDILEPCTLIHFGWWEISIENQNVWGREILVSSIFVGLCSLSMCTYSDVVGVI